MPEILQARIPHDVTTPKSLPGIAPLDPAEWLLVDDAFAAQMAERTRLIAERRGDVVALLPEGRPAADELLSFVLDWLCEHGAGYDVEKNAVVTRPDGARIPIDRADPLGTLGHLVQEDLCLMERRGAEHVLTGAVLCFPASWRLSEKVGRPMIGIHEPVREYDATLARRVQRLLDGVRTGRPLWRFNVLTYADPALFQPRSAQAPRRSQDGEGHSYRRSERQCLLRLPRTGAVAFSIHTYVVRR